MILRVSSDSCGRSFSNTRSPDADQARRNIGTLFVAPGFERQGIGSQLLKVMVKWLFEQSREAVWLTTGRNTRAEHFYSAAGWRAVGSATDGEIRFELSANHGDFGRPDRQIHLLGLPEGAVSLTAQIAGHEVVYSIISQTERPLDRVEVERRFDHELQRS